MLQKQYIWILQNNLKSCIKRTYDKQVVLNIFPFYIRMSCFIIEQFSSSFHKYPHVPPVHHMIKPSILGGCRKICHPGDGNDPTIWYRLGVDLHFVQRSHTLTHRHYTNTLMQTHTHTHTHTHTCIAMHSHSKQARGSQSNTSLRVLFCEASWLFFNYHRTVRSCAHHRTTYGRHWLFCCMVAQWK